MTDKVLNKPIYADEIVKVLEVDFLRMSLSEKYLIIIRATLQTL